MPKREIDVDDETFAKIQEMLSGKNEGGDETEDFIIFRGTAADFAKQFGFRITESEGSEGEGGEGKTEPKAKTRSRYFG